MNNFVFVFPGQGAQKSGMGKDIYEAYPEAKAVFDQFPDVRDICFEGDAEQLKQTSVTQPAIYLMSVAIDRVLKSKGLNPVKTAGHSLGEYAALTSAGVISLEDGMKIVQERGRLMQEAGQTVPGTMAAVIGLDDETVIEICNSIDGVIEAVNFNAPGQVVISGDKTVLENSVSIFKEKGARLVRLLPVSGAFHSSLLTEVGHEFKNFLSSFSFNDFQCPVVANVNAEEYQGKEQIVELLSKQIYNPVLWVKSIQNITAQGLTQFVEVGPGTVLKGLIGKINSDAEVVPIGTETALSEFLTR